VKAFREFHHQIAPGRHAGGAAVEILVRATEIARGLADGEDHPVGARLLDPPDVRLHVEAVHYPVQFGGALFRRGPVRLDQVVGHHSEAALGHPYSSIG